MDTMHLSTKHLPGDVLRFRDHAFQSYFSNPRYLDLISRKFGPATVLHVREMASHPLKRSFASPEAP